MVVVAKMEMGIFFKILLLVVVECIMDSDSQSTEVIFKDPNATLRNFDADKDDRLSMEEFGNLCKVLFQNENGVSYDVSGDMMDLAFKLFDPNMDGFITKEEFMATCYPKWIKKIVDPVSALVIVKMQNDFINGSVSLTGAPAKEDGADAIEPINLMLDTAPFKVVVYALDWLPANHIAFVDNVKNRKIHPSSKIQDPNSVKPMDTVVFQGKDGQPIEQTLWPRHAVQDSWGASLHPSLKYIRGSKKVFKGTDPEKQIFSAFLDPERKNPSSDLKKYVDEVGATDVYVCGIATDFCSGATALDSLYLGYRTVFVEDASKGVTPEGIAEAKKKIMDGNGVIVTAQKVANMVKGVDRRPELALYLAQQIQKKA